MTTTIETLTTARNLIEQGWCQGDYAKDHKGDQVPPESKDAIEFCSVGALIRAAGKNRPPFSAERDDLFTNCLKRLREAMHRAESFIEPGPDWEAELEGWQHLLKTNNKWGIITMWNDFSKNHQQEVVALYDRAIAIEKKEQRT